MPKYAEKCGLGGILTLRVRAARTSFVGRLLPYRAHICQVCVRRKDQGRKDNQAGEQLQG